MSWQAVCSVTELGDGEFVESRIGGVDLLVVRSGDAVVACPPVCPHQAEPLREAGICSDGVLTCTKHLWQWDLSTGVPLGEAEAPLLLYPTRTEAGVVHVYVERELRYADDD